MTETPLPPVQPIVETLGLVWHARTRAFLDGGLLHLAAASPGRVVGLFSHAGLGRLLARWGLRGPCAHWFEPATDGPSEPDERLFQTIDALLEARSPAVAAS